MKTGCKMGSRTEPTNGFEQVTSTEFFSEAAELISVELERDSRRYSVNFGEGGD